MAYSAKVRELLIDSDNVFPIRTPPVTPVLGSLHYVIIHQLSTSKGRIETYRGLQLGGYIEFDVPGLGRRVAEVVSRNGPFYECAFTLPFDPEALRLKRLGSEVVWPDFSTREPFSRPIILDPLVADEEIERLDPLIRVAIIVGLSAFLWTMIIWALW